MTGGPPRHPHLPSRRDSPAAGETSVLDRTPGLAAVLDAARGSRRAVVLIDGPSGAGKSTLADRLFEAWPGAAARLVRLDHVYPGWHGLDRGALGLRRDLLDPLTRDAPGRWRRWDWAADTVASIERMPPGRPIIVEGCGAFTAGANVDGALRVWITAPNGLRRRRALARDEGRFDDHWDLWETEWRRHLARTRADRWADLRVRVLRAGSTAPLA